MTEIPELAAAGTLDGTELMEVSQASSTVTITATTISALASDQSYNDSGSGFVAAGFTVGDRVRVQGFATNAVNNLIWGIVTAVTAGKLTIGGTEGAVIVDEAAGDSVTIYKWTSKRAVTQSAGDLGGGGDTGEYRAGITATVNNVTGDNTEYQIIWDNEIATATWASMNTTTGVLTLDAGAYSISSGAIVSGAAGTTNYTDMRLKRGGALIIPQAGNVGGNGSPRIGVSGTMVSSTSFDLTVTVAVEGASKTADVTNDGRTFLHVAKVG